MSPFQSKLEYQDDVEMQNAEDNSDEHDSDASMDGSDAMVISDHQSMTDPSSFPMQDHPQQQVSQQDTVSDEREVFSLGFGWRARERMQRSGVHPFNLPLEDLEEMVRLNRADSEKVEAPSSQGKSQSAEEIRQIVNEAGLAPESSPEAQMLAAAETDLLSARVVLQNAFLKERMKALRAVAAKALQKPAFEVRITRADALEAKNETRLARTKFDEQYARAKELRKAIEGVTDENGDDLVEQDPTVGNNANLLSEIDDKISEYQKLIWEVY